MNSGILDIERRIEAAGLELLRAYEALTNLVVAAAINRRNDISRNAVYPAAYVEAYNFVEFGLHTGWYLGGVRMGAMTYRDDDKSRAICEQIMGAFRMWVQQTDLVVQLNATVSATTPGSLLTFEEFKPDHPVYWDPTEEQQNALVLEATAVARPSRGAT